MSLLALAAAVGLTVTPIAPQAADTACRVLRPNNVRVAGRKSPLDSLTFVVAKQPVYRMSILRGEGLDPALLGCVVEAAPPVG